MVIETADIVNKQHAEEVKVKDRAKYQRRKEIIAQQGREFRKNDPARNLWKNAKHRASKLGIPFDITPEDIEVPKTCPALGCEIESGSFSERHTAPSLDRIVPELGYVKGNVCVISHRANAIKRDATAEELRRIADYIDRFT